MFSFQKWIFQGSLVLLCASALFGQEKNDPIPWFDYIDFHVGGSLDLAYSQTPLHHLSYLPDKDKLSEPFVQYFANSNRTVSSGVGFGFFAGAGYRPKLGSPFSFGLEYQFSNAGSEASRLTFQDPMGQDHDLSLSAGYLDHRIRAYMKVSPKVHRKIVFNFSLFMGLAILDLGNLVTFMDNNYNFIPLNSIAYTNGDLVFPSDTYYGLDVGFRVSFYMLNVTFDLALTPLLIIPRLNLGVSINQEIIKLFMGR